MVSWDTVCPGSFAANMCGLIHISRLEDPTCQNLQHIICFHVNVISSFGFRSILWGLH